MRISNGKPGSPCTEKHLAFNTEFTKEPICTASHKYQKLKIEHLQSLDLPAQEFQSQLNDVLRKECLCVGLSNAAAINYKQTFIKKLDAVTICPGPNIANFSKVVSLQTMIDHIYGRNNILSNARRPHMFIAELHLYIDYLKEQLKDAVHADQISKKKKYFTSFYFNLMDGIAYYRQLIRLADKSWNDFADYLEKAITELNSLDRQYAFNAPNELSV